MNGSGGSYAKKLPEPRQVFVLDFFCGCGGLSYAFADTRQSHIAYKILAGIDIDRVALQTYEVNVGAPGLYADIGNLSENPKLLSTLVPDFDSKIFRPLVFIGCAPCQGFSAHRKKDSRDDPRNSLLVAFAKISAFYKPDIVVMENVPEILTGRYTKYFRVAADKLEHAGYALTMDVLDLSLYGVPQRRRRAVVVGALEGTVSLPKPILTPDTVVTVRDAISHLKPVPSGGVDANDPWHRAPDHVPRILERIKKTPLDGGDRRSLSAEEQLGCHSALDNGTTPGFTDVYGRLRWDTPSVTITAKSSTPSCGRFLHPEQHRNITVREAAILQGFPQTFRFQGPHVHQYRQIGEAVPPIFGRFLAWQILDKFIPSQALPAVLVHGSRHETKPVGGDSNSIGLVDCFCGAGGLSLGFEAAGFKTSLAFDIDEDCVCTFRRNVSLLARQADINDRTLKADIDIAVGKEPYVMVGGPPCQGFSQQRRGKDEDPRNNLVLKYAKLVYTLSRKPLAIVLENVTYLDSPRGKEILAEYTELIRTLGYQVFRHDLNSAAFGIPQLRHRIIVVALRSNIAAHYSGPIPLTPRRWPTVGEALAGLPDASEHSLLRQMIANHDASKEGNLNKQRIAYVDMGGGRMAIPPGLQLPCHSTYNGHLDVYGRLDWFSQARTITGGFDSFTRGEFAHPFKHRSITPREAARIQGFPDWFVFDGNRASVRRQIGNAVPPSLAYGVALAVIKTVRQQQRDYAQTDSDIYLRSKRF
ncbi:MAG TPA: DNA cytosine methyltransferase [Candidatus Acidoferrales bacterium]|nr:DNA cytosine methyltransferase [Candidatus Acidoferrales bacterium]